MKVVGCTHCYNWEGDRCGVETGAEHMPVVPPAYVPPCPIADRCQHQIQANPEPCVVRARGMVCESAMVKGGFKPEDAMDHPCSFHAHMIISPEELAEEPWRGEGLVDQGTLADLRRRWRKK